MNNMELSILEVRSSGIFLANLSRNSPERTIITMVLTIGQNRLVGYLLRFWPWLLKNCLSVYVTLLNPRISKAIATRDPQKIRLPKIGAISEKRADIVPLMVIPSQNIRLQKLSLFRRVVSQFLLSVFIALSTKFTAFIVAYSGVKHKIHLLLLVITLFCVSPVSANSEKQEIEKLISTAEDRYNIPVGLLYSIAKVESGLKPYALNVEGKAFILTNTEDAINELAELLGEGITNIDVGVMQLNWHWHSQYFSSIQQILEPSTNIDYAGKLLKSLYQQHGSWQKAVRYYHSATPEHHRKYSRKVIMAWIAG